MANIPDTEGPQLPQGNRDIDEVRRQRHEAHVQQTWKAFLKDVAQLGPYPEDFAEDAAVCVVCALEQRILPAEAVDLESQLPRRFVELLGACPRPQSQKDVAKLDRGDFVSRVAKELGRSSDEAETIIRDVFQAVRAKISEGEADDVAANLPKDLAPLWMRPT